MPLGVEWKDLLQEAGVRGARLHDARHTAATVLLLLGVQERVAMEFMGWSNTAMDIEAAHAFGCPVIAYANRAGKADRFADHQPDAIITDLADLRAPPFRPEL